MQIAQSETPNYVFLGVRVYVRGEKERLHSKMTRAVSLLEGTRAEGRGDGKAGPQPCSYIIVK